MPADGVGSGRQGMGRSAFARDAGDGPGTSGRGALVRGIADASGAGGREVTGVISVRQVRHFTGERDGYIGELAVATSIVRQGIGRALIGAAREWAAACGLANLTLHTGAYNTGAREFYAALGFGEEEVRLTLPL
jgi:ribosomal protein S18 acetylase RimI-like enzyme